MKHRPASDQPGNGLLDEIEQLRTSLETALEENARLMEDRDSLLLRVSKLTGELKDTNAALSRQQNASSDGVSEAVKRQDDAEEELRLAFEELQVLTEELEVANTRLQETNQELDARVEERTRQLIDLNATLRAAEASFHTIADLVPDLLWRADRSGEAIWFNRRWFAFTGQSAKEPIGMGWLDAIHPLDRAVFRTSWGLAVGGAKAYEHQHRIRAADGSYRWFLVRAEPLRDEHGRVVNWFAAGTDIHDQRSTLEALEQSELRFRTLIEGIPQLVWRAVDGGKWTWSSPQWTAYTGQPEENSHAMGWLNAFHPDDREAARSCWAQANETGSLDFQGRIFHASERRYRHFRTRALPVRDDQRSIEWLGTSTDIDDLLQLQQQQDVLVKELQHRTRNLMAVVQAVTMRTIRGVSSLEDFKKCIVDRFDALARVQGLLSRRETGHRITFDLLLRQELSAHVGLDADGRSAQVSIDGPPGVSLRSATVQTLALALHELATNAVKYGALSSPNGHLHVGWQIVRADEQQRRLFIDWRETGVNMPAESAQPRGGGYGRELIERALPYQLGAQTSYEFEADGVHCTIAMAVSPEDIPVEKSDG